ncbi:hypothetical protein [Roseibium sp. MMSF_3544]|uniref:hypothetical protein n=1 Tax=unclassified Roseibium TaxID=2629323 RepID=UPI00273EE4DC|nr:hypothetical protein [Roseibium sp. MMSF_3544]
MANSENPNGRGYVPGGSDLRDAKPLLQAIFLGMVLAVALVAAATMANSDAEAEINSQKPGIEHSQPSDRPSNNPHGS